MRSNEITIILRAPDGGEFDAEVPLTSTGTEIINSMLEAEAVPRTENDGVSIKYDLVSQRTNRTIGAETLQSSGVTSGEVLNLVRQSNTPSPPPRPTFHQAQRGEVSVVIRIMPKGDEFDADLPSETTGLEIIQRILDDDIAPRFNPEGDPYEYELVSKRTNRSIDDQTLSACDIGDGDTLYVVPKMVAGGCKNP